MAREQVIKCDICAEPDARGYKISYDSVHYDVDLCPIHAAPLIEIGEAGRKTAGATPRATPGGRGDKALNRTIRGVPNLNVET